MDGLYNALTSALQGIRNQSLRFILAGLLLLTIAFVTLLGAHPGDPVPFYVLVCASVVLLIVGLLARMPLPDDPPLPDADDANPSGNRAVTQRAADQLKLQVPDAGDRTMASSGSQIEQLLDEARTTLHYLEAKAAAIPLSERTISLTRDLKTQRDLVAALEEQLRNIPPTHAPRNA